MIDEDNSARCLNVSMRTKVLSVLMIDEDKSARCLNVSMRI